MSTVHDKTKRAAKRYPYPRSALCEHGGDKHEVQIINLSTSGVQFATKFDIQSTDPIKVTWMDSKLGRFDLILSIARKIHQPDNKEFQFFYGSRYYKLSGQVKENLIHLLKSLRDAEINKNKVQTEAMTAGFLFDVIDKDLSILQNIFKDNAPSAMFENLINELKDYERVCFLKKDDVSVNIQKITTQNFHCNLFKLLLPLANEKEELLSRYFDQILTEFKKITDTELETEKVLHAVMETKIGDEEKKRTQTLLNESSNRLFYNKQSLLQLLIDTFPNIEEKTLDVRNKFLKIKNEYDRIQSFTTGSVIEEKQLYERKRKKPDDFSKIEAIVDVPVFSDKRPRYLLWLNIFLIVAFVAGFGAYKIADYKNMSALKESIDLQIDILKIEYLGTQLNLTIDASIWKSLPKKNRHEVIEKIVSYLQKSKKLQSCLIFDNTGALKKVLYKDTKVTEGKPDSPETPAAQISPPPPEQTSKPTEAAPKTDQPKSL